jgi:hypothetical protein
MALKSKQLALSAFACIAALLLVGCSISYKFNGASIDYNTVKTIQIDVFPIRSTYVWTPMQTIP